MEFIKLTKGFVLLKEIKPDNITKSGIYVTPIKWNRKFSVIDSASELVSVGMTVFVEIGKGVDLELNNEKYLVYHENNIMAIVEDGDK